MSKKSRIGMVAALLGSALLSVAAVGAACEGKGGDHAKMTDAERAQKRQERFRESDKNGDGFLTQAEVGERWDHIKTADANGDLKVTLAELEAAHSAKPHKGKGDKPKQS
jgi:hypothetical protein